MEVIHPSDRSALIHVLHEHLVGGTGGAGSWDRSASVITICEVFSILAIPSGVKTPRYSIHVFHEHLVGRSGVAGNWVRTARVVSCEFLHLGNSIWYETTEI